MKKLRDGGFRVNLTNHFCSEFKMTLRNNFAQLTNHTAPYEVNKCLVHLIACEQVQLKVGQLNDELISIPMRSQTCCRNTTLTLWAVTESFRGLD